jgi:methylated-DNA-[protein]-cysteine S-methyltransferase
MSTQAMTPATQQATIHSFDSELGWFALLSDSDGILRELTFGHASAPDAISALRHELADDARFAKGDSTLVRRLKRFAAGHSADFGEVRLDLSDLTDFQRRVVECCRRIPYGHTLSYGQLAEQAGFPRAARAVGNTMASNLVPLVVPCHRVLATGGRVGRYSAGEGTRTKLRLLEMESSETLVGVG